MNSFGNGKCCFCAARSRCRRPAGHRYRLRVNDGNHVGSGGGHLIYVNGKPLIETKTCNGRGSGGLPKGAYITGDFLDDFRKGEVTLAAVTFLRFNDKYEVKPSSKDPQGKFSLHLEEQKLPPMGDELVYKSATLVPMLSMEWQAGQDPEDREKSATARKYRWDGQWSPTPMCSETGRYSPWWRPLRISIPPENWQCP